MSNALAIAATTAALRMLLEAGFRTLESGLTGLTVTTRPLDVSRGMSANPQLNLFLYQTIINGAWRNMDMPRSVRPGETGNPPLALNLHYLITAYGSPDTADDAMNHRVLGCAMSVLHDHPLLGASEIENALANNDLAKQIERVRITPLPLSIDEMSKLWSTFQTQYRVSAAYEVTVILIDSNLPARAPLPVLRRGQQDRGVNAVASAAPALREVRPPRPQPATRLGEEVAIAGDNLQTSDSLVRFTSLISPPPGQAPPAPVEIVPQAGDKPDEIKVQLQNQLQDLDALEKWAPGFYTVSLVVKHPGVPPVISNEVAFALAPIVTLTPNSTTVANVNPGDTLTLSCTPRVRDGQRVLIMFGDQQVVPTARTNPNSSSPTYKETPTAITFEVPVVDKGLYLVRLRVDGVDSMPVILSGAPPLPAFDPEQQVSV